VNEVVSELGTGLDSGLNAHDWVNAETEESCLTGTICLIHKKNCFVFDNCCELCSSNGHFLIKN
jgi:hypothetical protein